MWQRGAVIRFQTHSVPRCSYRRPPEILRKISLRHAHDSGKLESEHQSQQGMAGPHLKRGRGFCALPRKSTLDTLWTRKYKGLDYDACDESKLTTEN
jgi:hypothetical protein